jgi:LacI family transcriptional regulator
MTTVSQDVESAPKRSGQDRFLGLVTHMRGLLQRGISIPQQMALIGYDDVEFAQSLSPALTSIRQPKYLLGYTATELLLNEVNESTQHQHKQIIYSPELIIRASTLPSP